MNNRISHRDNDINRARTMAAATQCDKLRLLMWKNLLLQRRRIVGTIFEILFPVFFVGILFFVRGYVESEGGKAIVTNSTTYTPFPIDTLSQRLR